MNIYRDLSEIRKNKNTVLSLGTFDGIHLGHREIINQVVEKASSINGRSFLITFYPHPRKILSKDFDIKFLTTIDEKISILQSLGVQNLLIINFTKEFSQLRADEFFKKYVIDSIGISEIIIGYDHHFGKGRSGDIETLKQMGNDFDFKVTKINAFKIDGESVNSSKIRNALSSGDIRLANSYLGRFYSFSGKVVLGDKRGRELGFPTANIKLDDTDKMLPELGIYAVEFFIDKKRYLGLLSVGKRPTFYNSGVIVPEVYIYDFNQDIYGKDVTVNIIEMIRREEKFNSADELIVQMKKDKDSGIEIFKKGKIKVAEEIN